jgi:ubiquinone/menaquinone biosynthesis C-methylase UbiE
MKMTTNADHNGYVIDAESPAEMARLINLDRFITRGMGGALAGIPARQLDTVLDIACGPGGWTLDTAFALPDAEVAGIDISTTMINYARARAISQGLKNASFETMNITRPLEFSTDTFDLVNARFLIGVLKREQWPAVLAECMRILRPGGILRLTETLNYGVTTSPAYEQFFRLCARALYKAGYGFSINEDSFDMTPALPYLLRKSGYEDVFVKAHALEIAPDREGWADFYETANITSVMLAPLFLKTQVADEQECRDLHEKILAELLHEDFYGMWHYVTAYGFKAA